MTAEEQLRKLTRVKNPYRSPEHPEDNLPVCWTMRLRDLRLAKAAAFTEGYEAGFWSRKLGGRMTAEEQLQEMYRKESEAMDTLKGVHTGAIRASLRPEHIDLIANLAVERMAKMLVPKEQI